MSKQFVPLTAEQLASAEKGYLKLEYRNGSKVMQLVWLKEPYDQSVDCIKTVDENGQLHTHWINGHSIRILGKVNSNFDLSVCEEQPKKYGGQLTGVPIEIVTFMLDQQEAQGNKRDTSVFEECFSHNKTCGGFDWCDTVYFDELVKADKGDYEPILGYLKAKKR